MKNGINPEPLKEFKKIPSYVYPLGDILTLPQATSELNTSFAEVIGGRQSTRIFEKIDLQQISNILWYSAKVRNVFISDEGNFITHRPSPSAGGIHPIDIFISSPNFISKRSLQFYNPFTHCLYKLNVDNKKLIHFFEQINKCLPLENATLIWYVAHLDRTASKYKKPDSLIWRDAGALIMTFQLVASGLNLHSCPIGTLAEPFLSCLFDKPNSIVSCGGLLIG